MSIMISLHLLFFLFLRMMGSQAGPFGGCRRIRVRFPYPHIPSKPVFSGWIKKEMIVDIPDTSEENLIEASSGRFSRMISVDRIVDHIFDSADSNRDGSVGFEEVYELVLKLYIKINQQAPIKPPTKKRALQLFLNADTTQTNALSREEFRGLANILARRALFRVATYKLVTLVGAPILSEFFMQTFTGLQFLPKLAGAMIPQRYEARLLPIVTSSAFWRTVLIVTFVSTLGKWAMNILDFFLNYKLGDADKDTRLQGRV